MIELMENSLHVSAKGFTERKTTKVTDASGCCLWSFSCRIITGWDISFMIQTIWHGFCRYEMLTFRWLPPMRQVLSEDRAKPLIKKGPEFCFPRNETLRQACSRQFQRKILKLLCLLASHSGNMALPSAYLHIWECVSLPTTAKVAFRKLFCSCIFFYFSWITLS